MQLLIGLKAKLQYFAWANDPQRMKRSEAVKLQCLIVNRQHFQPGCHDACGRQQRRVQMH